MTPPLTSPSAWASLFTDSKLFSILSLSLLRYSVSFFLAPTKKRLCANSTTQSAVQSRQV